MTGNLDTLRKAGVLSTRKLATQITGFLIGAALLAWCIHTAVQGGDWSRIKEASPWLIAGLAACSIVSLATNGAMFWLFIRPVRPVGFRAMQWLNLVAGLLNFLPVRVGMVARVAYHLKVDRMPLLLLGGWFAAITYVLAMAIGVCVLATLVRPEMDWIWIALIAGMLLLGGGLTRTMMLLPFVVRHGRGMDRMLSDRRTLWGGIVLRLVDISAYLGRMACAAAILGLNLPWSDIMILAIMALAFSVNPLGRFGFREWALTIVATRLIAADMTEAEIQATSAQLALIDSAGEAIVAIPAGAIALFWYVRQWRAAPPLTVRDATAAPAAPHTDDRGADPPVDRDP